MGNTITVNASSRDSNLQSLLVAFLQIQLSERIICEHIFTGSYPLGDKVVLRYLIKLKVASKLYKYIFIKISTKF